MPVIGKCLYEWKHNPYFSPYLNFIRGRQWANPRALILNIEGATDQSYLKNWSGTKYKAVLLYWSIECYIVRKAKPVVPLSTIYSSGHFDYPYAHIYQLNAEDFVVEIHHGHFHFFVNEFFKIFGSNVVPDVYSWNFLKFWFFPVVLELGLISFVWLQ